MSQHERNKESRRDAKTEAAQRKRTPRKQDGITDWTQADGNVLRLAVAAVACTGGALRLGYTRDGGAYAIGIYGDGDAFTEYVKPSEDINEYLAGLVADYGRE